MLAKVLLPNLVLVSVSGYRVTCRRSTDCHERNRCLAEGFGQKHCGILFSRCYCSEPDTGASCKGSSDFFSPCRENNRCLEERSATRQCKDWPKVECYCSPRDSGADCRRSSDCKKKGDICLVEGNPSMHCRSWDRDCYCSLPSPAPTTPAPAGPCPSNAAAPPGGCSCSYFDAQTNYWRSNYCMRNKFCYDGGVCSSKPYPAVECVGFVSASDWGCRCPSGSSWNHCAKGQYCYADGACSLLNPNESGAARCIPLRADVQCKCEYSDFWNQVAYNICFQGQYCHKGGLCKPYSRSLSDSSSANIDGDLLQSTLSNTPIVTTENVV